MSQQPSTTQCPAISALLLRHGGLRDYVLILSAGAIRRGLTESPASKAAIRLGQNQPKPDKTAHPDVWCLPARPAAEWAPVQAKLGNKLSNKVCWLRLLGVLGCVPPYSNREPNPQTSSHLRLKSSALLQNQSSLLPDTFLAQTHATTSESPRKAPRSRGALGGWESPWHDISVTRGAWAWAALAG